MHNFSFCSSRIFFSALLSCISILVNGQYEKNPLLPITNDGYDMVVEKFVKIPDDGVQRPRINSFTFFEERIFCTTELGGKIYEIVKQGSANQAVLFLDVNPAIFLNTGRYLDMNDGWHNGLRCLAFHPEFATNGKFYTSLMEQRPANTVGHHYISDVANPISNDGVLVEWTYDHTTESVLLNSYREVFRVGMPVADHTIKDIAFNRYAEPGDEDYALLYITHGDGSEQSATSGGGQRNDALGKVLRVNPLQSGNQPYSIPATNPFVNNDDWLDEIYSYGHRNPHTIAFGKDADGNVSIIVGEAGRDNMEEVNIIQKGGNYGWSQRDGTYVHLDQGGLQTGIAALPENDVINNFIYPSAQFSKVGTAGLGFASQAIAGGYVYTDPVSEKKIYLCADFAKSGRIFHIDMDELVNAKTKLDATNPDLDNPRDLTQAHMGEVNVLFDDDGNTTTPAVLKESMKDIINDEPDYDNFLGGRADLRFGQDKNEDVYISSKRNGWIYKIQSITINLTLPPVGVSEPNADRDVSLFPNPISNQDVLKITFTETPKSNLYLNVSIVDGLGRKFDLKSLTFSEQTIEIDLAPLSLVSGYYHVRIVSGNAINYYAFIIR